MKKRLLILVIMTLVGSFFIAYLGHNNQAQAIPITDFGSSGEISELAWGLSQDLVKIRAELEASKALEEFQFIENAELRLENESRKFTTDFLKAFDGLIEIELGLIQENTQLREQVRKLEAEKQTTTVCPPCPRRRYLGGGYDL